MERSKIYNALGALSAVLETGGLSDEDQSYINSAYVTLGAHLDTVGVVSAQPEETAPAPAPAAKLASAPDSEEEEQEILDSMEFNSNDPYIGEAYLSIYKESKPTVGVMVKGLKARKVRIGEKRVQALFDELVEGEFIKVVGKGKKNPKAAVEPENDDLPFEDLLDQLPKGDHVLVRPPFSYLMALDAKARKPYLKGLDVKKMVTAHSVAEATADGADLTLVNQIMDLADKKRKPVKDALDNIGEKGDKQGMKYAKLIGSCVSVIPDGDVLFNHMGAMGASLQTLRDLQTIAKAVRGAG